MENYVGGYFNSICYLLYFPVNLKLFLKSSLVKKKKKYRAKMVKP